MMDYIFGTNKQVETLKTVGTEHSDLSGFIEVKRHYPDCDITDHFRVVCKSNSAIDAEGKCYDWYDIADHYRYIDKASAFAPCAHKDTHKTGGSDALTPADIGAAMASHAHGNVTSDGKIGGVTLDNTLVKLVSGALQTLGGAGVSTGNCKIATGSYVGTGRYGESYPNSLIFDFVPKMLVIEYGQLSAYEGGNKWIALNPSPYLNAFRASSSDAMTNLTWGTTVTWHNRYAAQYQANSSGVSYCYTALG